MPAKPKSLAALGHLRMFVCAWFCLQSKLLIMDWGQREQQVHTIDEAMKHVKCTCYCSGARWLNEIPWRMCKTSWNHKATKSGGGKMTNSFGEGSFVARKLASIELNTIV